MKLKELPEDTNMQGLKLRLPDEALKAFKEFAGGEAEMYPVGPVMGYGFMLSPEPPNTSSRRLFPLPESIAPLEILEWDVVSQPTTKGNK